MPNWGYFQTIRIYNFRILRIADTSCNLITIILQSSIIILQSSPVITSYHTNLIIYSPHLFTSYHILHITLFVTLFIIPLFTIYFLPYILFTYHTPRVLPPSYHTCYSQSHTFCFISLLPYFLIPSHPLSFPHSSLIPRHFLSYHLYLSISLSISLISIHFLISLYVSIFYLSHISPTYFNLNILYITHMRDNISPYLFQTTFIIP